MTVEVDLVWEEAGAGAGRLFGCILAGQLLTDDSRHNTNENTK